MFFVSVGMLFVIVVGIAAIVRTHSSTELAYLIRQGVDRAVMRELELALEMTDYALRSAVAITRSSRTSA
jgi:hypothetical protein